MVVVHSEVRGTRRRSSLWVLLLVLSQLLSLSLAVHQEEEIPTNPMLLGRKAELFFRYKESSTRVEESFQEAPSPGIYEDDKRLVHTGPNPLHN